MNLQQRLKCLMDGHDYVTEKYELPTSWTGTYVYHAEIRTRRRCTRCDKTEDVKND